MLYGRVCCRRRGDECCIGGGVVGEGLYGRGSCRRRGDECCIGGGVVGEGVLSVAWEGVLPEKE